MTAPERRNRLLHSTPHQRRQVGGAGGRHSQLGFDALDPVLVLAVVPRSSWPLAKARLFRFWPAPAVLQSPQTANRALAVGSF
jgi:hypothetical protein